MKTTFKQIGLIGKPHDVAAIQVVHKVSQFLANHDISVALDEQTAQAMPGVDLPSYPLETLGQHSDLIIVVGGDGSILRTARYLAGQPAAVLGINRGYLGFLADIDPENFEQQISDVLKGEYVREQRFLLESSIWRDDECIGRNQALNEVVLHYGKVIQMMDFDVFVDGHFVNHQRSDGVIVATPTGSTAYALSGGGPVLHPDTNALVMVPILPHTLSYRPIVLDANSRIEIRISKEQPQYPRLGCDSQIYFSLMSGDRIVIEKSSKLFNLIHPKDYNYYAALREKLHWGKDLAHSKREDNDR